MGIPMKQLAHLGEITYASGARVPFNIPRLGVLFMLMLRLKFTITNGGTAAAAPFHQTLARIIKKLELTVNGRDTIVNLSGFSLASLAFLDNGIIGKGMGSTVVLTGSAATQYTVHLPLWLACPRGIRPDDTGLDFRKGIEAVLNVEFANSDCSDIYGTPNSAAISGVTCEISALSELDPPALADGKPQSYAVRTLDQIVTELTASNSALQIPLDKGSGVFIRSVMMETLAADVAVDTILANGMVELGVGNVVIDKVKAEAIKNVNYIDGRATEQTGVYQLFKPIFGSGQTMVPTKGLTSDLVLKLDATKVSGVNKIITTREGFRDLIAFG
ncbi:hypothetical protein [Ferrovibrio terrae]|uniref:hypothetical protein n=1 Tax=Ferrovibrio terrae TaxID=2594003 RepID=UPI003138159E